MNEIDFSFITYWANKYDYDDEYYDKYIDGGKSGDINSLRKLTEWKNASSYNKPLQFDKNEKKEQAFQYLIQNLDKFLDKPNSKKIFQSLFPNNGKSLIWSKFWYHVFFDEPIYDIYTNVSFIYFTTGVKLTTDEARMNKYKTWEHYNDFCSWVKNNVLKINKNGFKISNREFDRAILEFGKTIIDRIDDETILIDNKKLIIGKISFLPSLKEINFSFPLYKNRFPEHDTEISLKIGKYKILAKIGKKSNTLYLKSPTNKQIFYDGQIVSVVSYEDMLNKLKLSHGDKLYIIGDSEKKTYTVIQLLRQYELNDSHQI
ncbi:MAG: hypothetical protein WDA74_06360 [Spirochaetota bacterium]